MEACKKSSMLNREGTFGLNLQFCKIYFDMELQNDSK